MQIYCLISDPQTEGPHGVPSQSSLILPKLSCYFFHGLPPNWKDLPSLNYDVHVN